MENAFTILPMSQNFTLVPGETYTGSITVVNPVNSTSDFAYSVSVSPYNVIGEDYQATSQMFPPTPKSRIGSLSIILLAPSNLTNLKKSILLSTSQPMLQPEANMPPLWCLPILPSKSPKAFLLITSLPLVALFMPT